MLPVCWNPVFPLLLLSWSVRGYIASSETVGAWVCVRLCMCVCVCVRHQRLWWSIKSSQTKSSLSPHALCIGITFHQVTEKPQRCLSLASILKAKQRRRCVILTATVELSTCYINKSCISQQERRQQQPVWWRSTHKKKKKKKWLNADRSGEYGSGERVQMRLDDTGSNFDLGEKFSLCWRI